MKNLLLTTIAFMTLTTSISALAYQEAYEVGADQMTEIIKCRPLELRPDLGMQLTVSTGGIADLSQIEVTRFFLGHSSSNTYIVNAAPRRPDQLGEAETYKGAGIFLSINFTTSLPNGSSYGFLKIKENEKVSFELLSCELIAQNPQVNYAY